jgi:hypothetical protein
MNAKEFVQIKPYCIKYQTDCTMTTDVMLIFSMFLCCTEKIRVSGLRKIITAETLKMLSLKQTGVLS